MTSTNDHSVTATKPVARPSRRTAAAASAAAAVALATGGWFALWSPHESAVRLSVGTDSAVPGKPLAVSGVATPVAANRVVQLSVATSSDGPYTSAGTAVTDAAGRFAVSWSPAQAGKAWVKATATELGRDQAASSPATSVTVRTPGTVKVSTSAATLRTTGKVTLSAQAAPTGDTITLEKSSDGQTWSPVTATPAANGSVTATLSKLTAGTWQVRARAAQTDTATAATSKPATLLVEDYKAAGAKYLQIVAGGNKAITKLNDMIDSGASQARLRTQAETISKAFTKQAAAFRDYKGWPREVAPIVKDLAKQTVLQADQYHQQARSSSIDEWNAAADLGYAAGKAGGSDAARIRDLLGLPKRPA